MRKALNCLYIAVDEHVARDVCDKLWAAFGEAERDSRNMTDTNVPAVAPPAPPPISAESQKLIDNVYAAGGTGSADDLDHQFGILKAHIASLEQRREDIAGVLHYAQSANRQHVARIADLETKLAAASADAMYLRKVVDVARCFQAGGNLRVLLSALDKALEELEANVPAADASLAASSRETPETLSVGPKEKS